MHVYFFYMHIIVTTVKIGQQSEEEFNYVTFVLFLGINFGLVAERGRQILMNS